MVEDRAKRRLVRKPAHLHGPLDHLSRPVHQQSLTIPSHRNHAEINLRGQPPVEPDLLVAKVAAAHPSVL